GSLGPFWRRELDFERHITNRSHWLAPPCLLDTTDIDAEIAFGHKCQGTGQCAVIPENRSGTRCRDRRQQSLSRSISYVAFKILFAALEIASGTGGHINADATLRRAFLVGRRGRVGANSGRDPDPRRSTKNVLG